MTTQQVQQLTPGIYRGPNGNRIVAHGTLRNDQVVYEVGDGVRRTISRPLALKTWKYIGPKCPPADEVKGGNRIAAGLLLTVALAVVGLFATLAAAGKVEW